MDEFNESLAAAQLKMNDLRETSSSLLLFSLQWKDLEAHYDSLLNVLSQREKEVRALEESVECRLRSLEERCREFEVKRSELDILDESMKVLRKKIEVRECEFSEKARLAFEAKGREIEEKVEVLESVRREIAERLVEIEERERRLERVFGERDTELEKKGKELEELWSKAETEKTEIECRDGELEKKKKELEELMRRIKSREMENECKSRELETKKKELKELRKKIQAREKEMKFNDREFGVRCQEYEENVVKLEERLRDVERREKESENWYKEQFELLEVRKREMEEKIRNVMLEDEKLKEWCGEIESWERKLDERVEEVDLKEKRLEELAEKLESGKRELEEKVKEANLKGQSLEERLDEFALEKREFEERFKEGTLRERRLLEGIKELEVREEQLQERNWEIKVAKNRLNMAVLTTLKSEEPCNRGVHTAAGVVVQHCVVMDGRALQILLNEHWEEHDKIRDTVSALLRFCSDPAKLVLDAIVGFYPPHLKHGDFEFEASVVRNSCLLLLEQLMEIGPEIKPRVKGEAMKLSFDWITKMSVDSEHYIEVVAFLEVVSAYGLADAFDANELLDYAENVAYYRQIPKLSQLLGLAGKIPGLIRNLLKREQHLIALGFIVEFNLSDEFPPAALLDDFMKLSENAVKETIREGNNSIEAQDEATAKRIAELEDVIRRTKYHHSRPGFSAGSIEQMIDSLKQKASQDKAASPTGNDLQTTELDGNDHNDSPSVDAAVSDSADISASVDSPPHTNDATIAAAPLIVSIQQQANLLMEALPNSDDSIPTSVCPLECQLQTEPTADKGSFSGEAQHFDVNVKGLRKLLGEDLAYELVQDDILCVLKSSSDPARLVLDAMGNDPKKLIGIPVKSCIMLLEDVKKLSPVINSQVEAEARQYAKIWILKLELKKDDHMEVICFMQFLLVYDLCGVFEEDKVCRLLDPSNWLKKFTQDCQLLGVTDLLPNFVEHLIANKCLLRAIGYICTFKLDDKFPPEPLLRQYLMNARKKEDAMCEGENVSPANQITALIQKLRAAIKCIDHYGIGSKDMCKCLQEDLEQLEKQKTEKIDKLDAGSNGFQLLDNVKGLPMLLRGDVAYKSLKDEISRVMKSSPDPAYLVLVTIKNIGPSHLEGDKGFEVGIPIKSCILLLEQLQSIFPEIKPGVHDEARQFWKSWRKKLKLTKDDHMGVLCYMLFFKVYNTRSNLNPDDVIGLLNPFGWKQVSESCRKLGLKDVYPESFIQKMITKKQWLKAVKYIYAFRLDDKFPVVTLLKDYLLHRRSKGDELFIRNNRSPRAQVLAINVKLQAARDVVGCIKQHNLYSLYPLGALEDEIEKLERQKEEKAQKGDKKTDCKSKRKPKHWDREDEKATMDPVGTFKTSTRKKKKRKCESSTPMVKAPRQARESPFSYYPWQPPTQPSLPPKLPLPLPSYVAYY